MQRQECVNRKEQRGCPFIVSLERTIATVNDRIRCVSLPVLSKSQESGRERTKITPGELQG